MQIGMLGPLEVRGDDGALIDVPGARLRGLLAALARDAGRAVPKAALVDWIWGGRPPTDASNALQRLASRLRKVLPEAAVEGRADGYLLAVGPEDVDAVRFERLVGRAREAEGPRRVRLLREALGLWRGAPMQDIGLRESAAFDATVTRLSMLRLNAMEDRYDAETGSGGGAELVAELTDLVAAHPVRERLVAALMRALVASGRDAEALLVYQRTREALAAALGTDPAPELSALHVAILQGELRGGPKPREERRRTNLRAELTRFVGKDADVAAVGDLVAGHRLTTLTGPGGAGKTRLAAETARTLLDGPEDGVWLVELAALGAEGDVAQSTLDGLGLRDALLGATPDTDATDRLIAAVREREALLVLDNCEHVIESAAAFAQRVLGACPRLRILATSREPLGITGEALWPVEPLGLPEADADPAAIAASPAVRLLRDRAGAIRGGLAVDDRALSTMARVCRALDGMPLAIELAAARLRTMSLDQLADRLHDRFRLLTGGSRTALPRHRTLRGVVDWSWELLTDAERTVLRRLSVFAGGASLEAAERVCASEAFAAQPVEAERVLELLTSLTEKSLLRAEGDDAPRYRMISTIAEYARGRLAEAGESDPARRAHLAYFTGLAETAEPRLRRSDQLTWLAVLEAAHDDLGAAMRGALAAGETDAALRLAAGAGWYWWLSGHRAEGLELIVAAARMPGDAPDETRAMVCALVVLFLTSGRGDERQAAEWIRRAHRFDRRSPRRHPLLGLVEPMERMLRSPEAFLPAFESLLDDPDPWVRALARLHLGKARVMLGRGVDADAYLEKALGEFRVLGERFGIAFALTELAEQLAMRGEFAEACEHYEQAIATITEVGAVEDLIRLRARQAQLYRLLGDGEGSASALAAAERCAERVAWPHALAELALAKADLARWDGDGEEARRQLDAATAVLGDEAERAHLRAAAQDLLGYLAEDLGQARAHRAAACRAATEARHAPLTAQVLVGVADLALRRDQCEQAARLLAASAAVRGLADRSLPDAARIEREARRRLGDERFAEASSAGAKSEWAALAAVTLDT
ncbi:BTAD domain-containing putative transcriptional regulator [Glycomyces sp. NRRL B-16210]|uniref:BTAD domain-containing putative transcriptional regulator n=1 Tax=Glycomyces sp. NRRL B-16210 TaxID=1463821 RepID=UPI0004C23987|nr:BTAD domain-containing putative transcriptional regulator [Glycomyces sp. NRRL B-16210]